MKLLKLTTFYPSYLKDFYRRHPRLAEKSFAEQKAALDYDAFGWADYWTNALIPLGYDVMEITMNAYPMQRAWANENIRTGYQNLDIGKIVLAQVKKFQPEILWFDDYEATLLTQLRSEVPSIRLVLGWAGSTILKSDVWRHADLILSCAPESVEFFRKAGLKAVHMNHAFDPRINARLTERSKNIDFSFIGQLIRSRDFHLVREQLLEQLAAQTGITIYSPSANLTLKDELRALVVSGVYDVLQFLMKIGISESALCNFPGIGI
jgi:spore maturation protein CgeB